MTTAASTGSGFRVGGTESANEAFAIPIARALSAAKAIEGGTSTDSVHVGPRAVLGVEIQGQLGGRTPIGGTSSTGVPVAGVSQNSPAADAGITAGSTIVGIGDTTVRTTTDITSAMNKLKPDTDVKVTWIDSSGQRQSANVHLTEGPPL